MDEINAIAKKHGLKVLEDAAHAHGSEYKGKKAGNLGDMAMFSLNGTKNLPGGEGGFVTTNDPDFYEKARLTCMFGEKKVPKGNIRPYDAYTMGNNYRPVEMTCAFVRSQLKRLDEYNRKRIENVHYLSRQLGKIKGVITPPELPDRTSVYHIYRLKLDPVEAGYPDVDPEDFRWAVQNALFAEGVPVMEWHSFPVPGQSIFQNLNAYGKGCPWNCGHAREGIRYDQNDFPGTQKMFASTFVLYNIYASNGLELMKYYVDAFHKVFDYIDEIATDQKYYKRVRASLK
jgi:dTDP-4-amino-4,6-dideoxygalactose transaminase